MCITGSPCGSDAFTVDRNRLLNVLTVFVQFAQMVVQPDVSGVSAAYFFVKVDGLCDVAHFFVFFGDSKKQERIIW